MKRVIGLIDERKGVEKQREVIEEYCTEHDMMIADWKSDGIGFVAYGNWMHGMKYDAVVVADSAIVSDNIFRFYAYKSVLKRRHCDLIAVRDDFPGTALYRKVLDTMIDTICEIEIQNEPLQKVSDRTDKVARGAYIGGRAPMGYRISGGQLEVNEEEAKVVRFIIERKRQGKTMLGTVDALNKEGYQTRNGKLFVISTVQSIWNNEKFYEGYRRFGKDGEWVKGQHEAIIKSDRDGKKAGKGKFDEDLQY